MNNLLSEMKNGLQCNVLPGGKLQLVLIKDGMKYLSNPFDGEAAALVAQSALETARLTHQQSGMLMRSGTERESRWATVTPSTIGLGPSQLPGHECLILKFGDAQLGIQIPNAALRGLAEAMLALSAQSPNPN